MKVNYFYIFFHILFSCQNLYPQTSRPIYPVIFVHGLNSDNTLWDTTITNLSGVFWKNSNNIFYAVLNANAGTNLKGADNILGTGDDDVLVSFNNNSNQLSDGDIFAVNFKNFWNEDKGNPQILTGSTATPGNHESGSSQSSIYKQGYALKKTIEAVLNATGAEKVILVGHSMGGLAIREYLQRRDNQSEGGRHTWWLDPSDEENGHKVAKVITIGTPHRGSNLTGLLSSSFGIDESSEAVRDLRFYNSSSPNIFSGVYLFGGSEGNIKLYDPSSNPKGFYNTDVNCNGFIDSIAGLNNGNDGTGFNMDLPLPTNLGYTYIISSFLGAPNDLFVDVSRQWMYNQDNLPVPLNVSDSLRTNKPHVRIFSTLSEADDYYSIVRGLDEPNIPSLAYNLESGKQYTGLATIQSNNLRTDYDWYKTTVQRGLIVLFTSRGSGGGRIDLYTSKPESNSDSQVFMNFTGTQPLTFIPPPNSNAGEYFIRVQHNNVNPDDWKAPYSLSILDSSLVVPVELTSFSGKVNARQIILNWSTSTETNNKGFEIETRRNKNHEWEKIGFVSGNGTITEKSDYIFLDDYKSAFFTGIINYRLKQIDYDGTGSYSKEIEIKVDFKPEEFNLYQNYPNPFNPVTVIKYVLPEESIVSLSVFNSLGEKVKDLINKTQMPGYWEISWNADNFASGIYLAKLNVVSADFTKNLSKTIKMVLIR